MRVTAAVEPGTNTAATPRSTPAVRTTLETPSVRSMTSPSPPVENRSWPVWTGTASEACPAGEGLAVRVSHVDLVHQRTQPLHLVRGHRVAVLRLGVAAGADLLGERPDPGDHLLPDVGAVLHEAREVTLADPQEVVEDEHLAVRGRTRADPDHRHPHARHDQPRELARHGLEHHREAAGVLKP